MLIRRPAREVFNAIADPVVTTKFWFTKSSGALREGETVTWQWEMYGASADVTVVEMIPFEKIAFTWDNPARLVEFHFREIAEGTYVMVRESGYGVTDNDLIAAIADSTGGFTTMLDAMKAWLERGISLNLVADKFRDVRF